MKPFLKIFATATDPNVSTKVNANQMVNRIKIVIAHFHQLVFWTNGYHKIWPNNYKMQAMANNKTIRITKGIVPNNNPDDNPKFHTNTVNSINAVEYSGQITSDGKTFT